MMKTPYQKISLGFNRSRPNALQRISRGLSRAALNSAGLAGKLAVVAHDAGGAAILASFVAQEKVDALFVLAGPAEQIFQQLLGNTQMVSLSEAIVNCDWLLTGTGWQTDYEWQAIRQGRAAGRYVVTFLDHWVNYPDRFVKSGVLCYPNEIWVGDEYAADLARKTLPGLILRNVGNPYFRYFVSEVDRISSIRSESRQDGTNILFVCENINSEGFHQNDAIRYFMSNIHRLSLGEVQVVIRHHPSEPADKYAWVLDEFGGDVKLSTGVALAEEVADSHIVAGCSSMAMALAVMADRRVISCIPGDRPRHSLPFEEIEQLCNIL